MGGNFSSLNILVNKDNAFTAEFPNLTHAYKLPKVTTDEVVERWSTEPISFYQNQFNFAVYCATTACGVGFDLLSDPNPYISALFNFHVYYTVRKILNYCVMPIPSDDVFDALHNNYDQRNFANTCLLYGVDPNKSYKQTRDTLSNGLGTAYYYDNGYIPVPGKNYDAHDLHITNGKYAGSTYMGFGWAKPPKGSGHASTYTVTWISQSDAVTLAWWDFILKKSQLTNIGLVKVNESIRAYVYALLGSQVETKVSILSYGTGLIAQQRFKTIIEAEINPANPDSEKSTDRFQDMLQKAKTPLDYVLAPGLYIIPSNMDLRIGVFEGYNNNLQVATGDMQTGYVQGLNLNPVAEDNFNPQTTTTTSPTPTQTQTPTQAAATKPLDAHNEEKLSLTIGAVAVGVIGFTLYRILT